MVNGGAAMVEQMRSYSRSASSQRKQVGLSKQVISATDILQASDVLTNDVQQSSELRHWCSAVDTARGRNECIP